MKSTNIAMCDHCGEVYKVDEHTKLPTHHMTAIIYNGLPRERICGTVRRTVFEPIVEVAEEYAFNACVHINGKRVVIDKQTFGHIMEGMGLESPFVEQNWEQR